MTMSEVCATMKPGDVFVKISEPEESLGGAALYPVCVVRINRKIEQVDRVYVDSVAAKNLASAVEVTRRIHS